MTDIKYVITMSLGILSQGIRNWQKEINLVRQYDLPKKQEENT